MKISIDEIRKNIFAVIINHPNSMMIKSYKEKYDTNSVDISIELQPAFHFNAQDESCITITFDLKNGYDDKAVSKKIYEVLDTAHVKEDYLYYDSSDIINASEIIKRRNELSKEFFYKTFNKLNSREAELVLKYATKNKYKDIHSFHTAFTVFYHQNGRLPYDYEPLGKARIAALEDGFLDEKTNYLISGLTASELFKLYLNESRFPNEDEAAYEKAYLPAIEDYRNGKYCLAIMVGLDMLNLMCKKQTMGDMIFAQAIETINNNYSFNIDQKNCRVKYHEYGALGITDTKYHMHKCYRKKIWFYNDKNKLVSKDLIILYKGMEHFITKDDFNEIVSGCEYIKDNIDLFDLVFNDYCVEHDIPVVTIQAKDLIVGPDEIYRIISNEISTISKKTGKEIYNSESAAYRALTLKNLHNIG